LRAAFSLVPEYLRTSDEAESLSDYGPALGRRFRSLKLWTVLRCYGREGLQARIREAIRLAELFESWVRGEPGWGLSAPRRFSVVCFRRDGTDEDNEAIVGRVNRSGELFLSHTRLNGRYVIRRRSATSAPRRRTCGAPGRRSGPPAMVDSPQARVGEWFVMGSVEPPGQGAFVGLALRSQRSRGGSLWKVVP